MKKTYWQEVHEQCAEKDNMRLKTNKYRCEQTIITKLNGVPACTIRTKSDYQFEWAENLKRPAMNAYCKLLEQFVSVYPPSYQKPLEMIIDLEKLKFESVFDIDMATGKMAGIVNHNEIVEKWQEYKKNMLDNYSFLRSADTKENVNAFIDSMEKVVVDEKLLMAEFYGKMIFLLLFDGYLVGKPNYAATTDIEFPSQLFQGVKFPMTLTPRIQKESVESVIYELKSSVSDSVKLTERIKKEYDERFKPTIQYSFSSYDAQFNSHVLLNEKERYVQEAECYIIEEIVNNLNLTIHCKIRQIV